MINNIEKNSSIPLYRQLKNMILNEIKSNSLAIDSKIPSERELSEKYGISRMTARRAIDDLVKDKYLIRIIGKGTYVIDISKSSEFTRVISFTEDMLKLGYSVKSKILKFNLFEAGEEVLSRLKCLKNEKVFEIVRLRLADNVPMALQSSYILSKFCPNLLDYDLSVNSLYGILEKEFKLKPSYANNILETKIINREEMNLFGVQKEIALFVLDQTTYLENGVAFEYVISIYRGDKYKFSNIALNI